MQCPDCGEWTAQLYSTDAIEANHEVVVPGATHLTQPVGQHTHEITFDGGARAVGDDRCVAGAGAILWGPSDHTQFSRLATVEVLLPAESDAQVAEAWGAHAALSLLDVVPPAVSVRIAGDNLAVVRYCAAHGRLRRPDMAMPLERPLGDLSLSGRTVEWMAVPRRLNGAADAIATHALQTSATLPPGPPILRRLSPS